MGIHSFSDLNSSLPEKQVKQRKPKTPETENTSSLFDKPEKQRKKKIEEMSYDEVVLKAKDIILYALSMSPKTRKQLEDKLKEKNIPEAAAKEALEKMTEVGLIDDQQFAKSWVYSRYTYKGLSAMAIKRELKLKGVDEDIINEALETVGHDEEWQKALEMVARKAKSTKHLDKQVRVRRLVGMLARKGYNGNIAFNAVKEILNNETDEEHIDWVEE